MNSTPEERWRSYVDGLTWQKSHLDESSWFAFLRAGSLQMSPEDVMREVARRIEKAGDHAKEGKLQRQLRRAYEHAGVHAEDPRRIVYTKPPKLIYEPGKLSRVASNINFDVTAKWLIKVSPLSTRSRSPAGFLHQLFKEGEYVLVFDIFESQGHLWEHKGAVANLSVNYLQRRQQNVWFASQPVDGFFHWNPREQKQSRRSEESVTA
jgi:hypothetical protein